MLNDYYKKNPDQITLDKLALRVFTPGAQLIERVDLFDYYQDVIETAARNCYKSEARLGISRDMFLKRRIETGHLSVFEHRVVTARLIMSRSASHQLVRHRIAAYSQESQRFCDYTKDVIDIVEVDEGLKGLEKEFTLWCLRPPSVKTERQIANWEMGVLVAYRSYLRLRADGVPPEDARENLPNATKTEIVTTFNLPMWRHVFTERALNPHAQWQIRGIFQILLTEFTRYMPVIFGDLYDRLAGEALKNPKFDAREHVKLYLHHDIVGTDWWKEEADA